ncbi:MAG: Hpt domain-containing protein [Magnetovibrio sp.]|nr:Hpt domain-containing protein [Magnetovibrio sp.]
MSDDFNGVYAHGVEGIAHELRQECLDEAKELVSELDLCLDDFRHERIEADELLSKVSRTALKLRVQAGNVGLRLLGTVAHRLEDFIVNAKALPPGAADDLQVFIDRLEDITDGRLALDSDAGQVVRDLPAKVGFSESDIEVRNIEVMLVMLHGTANHYVERELQQCGYRVHTVTTTFEALPMIVRTQPDFLIISAIMPELDGIDLAIGLSAMPATRNIPLALITSLDDSDEHLSYLPSNTSVIHKGPSFGDDLFKALDNHFLI